MAKKTEMMGFEKNKRFAKEYNNIRTYANIGGKDYNFRSKAEFKVADYLQLLKTSYLIKDWAYEQTKFCFPDKDNPVMTWLVDFDVLENDGSFYYIEYKGYVEPSVKRKLNLLAKYRPEVKLDMVFGSNRDLKRLGVRATACCRRVCTLGELTKGI